MILSDLHYSMSMSHKIQPKMNSSGVWLAAQHSQHKTALIRINFFDYIHQYISCQTQLGRIFSRKVNGVECVNPIYNFHACLTSYLG